MRRRVGAIIFEKDHIILIKRVTKERTYWVFPGGEIERGETKKEALARECKEELGIDVSVKKLFAKITHVVYRKKQREYFYLCEKTGGEPGTGTGPEFSGDKKYYYRGTYEVVLVFKKNINKINLLPEEAKNIVLDKLVIA